MKIYVSEKEFKELGEGAVYLKVVGNEAGVFVEIPLNGNITVLEQYDKEIRNQLIEELEGWVKENVTEGCEYDNQFFIKGCQDVRDLQQKLNRMKGEQKCEIT